MTITVKKKSLKIKNQNSSPEGVANLNDLPDLSELPSAHPQAVMGGSVSKKKSGEYLITGIFGIVALLVIIFSIVLQYNELAFFKDRF